MTIEGNYYIIIEMKDNEEINDENNTQIYARWCGKYLGSHNGKAVFSAYGEDNWEGFIKHIKLVPISISDDKHYYIYFNGYKNDEKSFYLNGYSYDRNFNHNPFIFPFNLMEK